jgi:hypothetical protein
MSLKQPPGIYVGDIWIPTYAGMTAFRGPKGFSMNNAKTRGRRPKAYPGGTLRMRGSEDDKVRREIPLRGTGDRGPPIRKMEIED